MPKTPATAPVVAAFATVPASFEHQQAPGHTGVLVVGMSDALRRVMVCNAAILLWLCAGVGGEGGRIVFLPVIVSYHTKPVVDSFLPSCTRAELQDRDTHRQYCRGTKNHEESGTKLSNHFPV